MIDAAIPWGSSVGWFGWRRTESRPGSPSVLRKRVTTRAFLRDEDQVLVAHELRDGRGHSGCEPGRERRERSRPVS